MPRALVTGCAGFIGSHLCERLLEEGWDVVGVDGFTQTYARSRKERHLEELRDHLAFRLVERDLADEESVEGLVEEADVVWHLAARAGVRNSFGGGFRSYVQDNVLVTQRLLDAAAAHPVSSFVYASSSSVYGDAAVQPTPEEHELRPVSPYGMTKLATEALARTYHDTFGVPAVGLRYFTVYGPRQRPDMAFSRFISAGLAGRPIAVHGSGEQLRDFTYVADAVDATVAARDGRPGTAYNVGGGTPVRLMDAIADIAAVLDRPLDVRHHEVARGDARRTQADGRRCEQELGVRPATPLRAGLRAQVQWLAQHVACAEDELVAA